MNVGKPLFTPPHLINIRELILEKGPINAMNVIRILAREHALFNTREFTQERSPMHAVYVVKPSHRVQISFSTSVCIQVPNTIINGYRRLRLGLTVHSNFILYFVKTLFKRNPKEVQYVLGVAQQKYQN